ncbi:hypothetical protein QC820_10940 [Halomonas mongoliensis]|uniref:Chromosome partition protein Smc n=1 Tax=Halomonas mongoliensis TaxID=321265 RepID=A0ABU1GMR9_9GAMM|nr:hypothetical protein [Halomonas mongoliensis]MDR5893330.1 hypothetical protein [Halomonas mongoliensis]
MQKNIFIGIGLAVTLTACSSDTAIDTVKNSSVGGNHGTVGELLASRSMCTNPRWSQSENGAGISVEYRCELKGASDYFANAAEERIALFAGHAGDLSPTARRIQRQEQEIAALEERLAGYRVALEDPEQHPDVIGQRKQLQILQDERAALEALDASAITSMSESEIDELPHHNVRRQAASHLSLRERIAQDPDNRGLLDREARGERAIRGAIQSALRTNANLLRQRESQVERVLAGAGDNAEQRIAATTNQLEQARQTLERSKAQHQKSIERHEELSEQRRASTRANYAVNEAEEVLRWTVRGEGDDARVSLQDASVMLTREDEVHDWTYSRPRLLLAHIGEAEREAESLDEFFTGRYDSNLLRRMP